MKQAGGAKLFSLVEELSLKDDYSITISENNTLIICEPDKKPYEVKSSCDSIDMVAELEEEQEIQRFLSDRKHTYSGVMCMSPSSRKRGKYRPFLCFLKDKKYVPLTSRMFSYLAIREKLNSVALLLVNSSSFLVINRDYSFEWNKYKINGIVTDLCFSSDRESLYINVSCKKLLKASSRDTSSYVELLAIPDSQDRVLTHLACLNDELYFAESLSGRGIRVQKLLDSSGKSEPVFELDLLHLYTQEQLDCAIESAKEGNPWFHDHVSGMYLLNEGKSLFLLVGGSGRLEYSDGADTYIVVYDTVAQTNNISLLYETCGVTDSRLVNQGSAVSILIDNDYWVTVDVGNFLP